MFYNVIVNLSQRLTLKSHSQKDKFRGKKTLKISR